MALRSRERILENLDAIYREAYDRAKAAAEGSRMQELDWAYQREQLILEVLLDIRDSLSTAGGKPVGSALESLEKLRRLTKR